MSENNQNINNQQPSKKDETNKNCFDEINKNSTCCEKINAVNVPCKNISKNDNEHCSIQKNNKCCDDKFVEVKNENSFAVLLPNLPQILPQEPFEFQPPLPTRRFAMPMLSGKNLAKKIYVEMLRAIKDYGELEALAPQQDKKTISSLKSQMQILSLAMLNVYQELSSRPTVPYFGSSHIPLSNEYQKALQEMYNRVFHIHSLTLRLFNQTTGLSVSGTILIILTNLKSQLKTLNSLQTPQPENKQENQ